MVAKTILIVSFYAKKQIMSFKFRTKKYLHYVTATVTDIKFNMFVSLFQHFFFLNPIVSKSIS